jgi:site-specific recombinase XerD
MATWLRKALALLAHIQQRAIKVGGRRALAPFAPRSARLGLVGELLDEYLEELGLRSRASAISQDTLRTYRSWLRPGGPFARWREVSLEEIRYRDLHLWSLELAAQYKPKSVRLYVRAMDGFPHWCVHQEYLEAVPPRPKISVPGGAKEILQPAEQRAVLETIREDLRGIFLLMALGVRPNCARAVQAIDYQGGYFVLRRRVEGPARTARITHLGQKNGRWHYLPATEELARWIRSHRLGARPEQLLFPDADGRVFAHGRLRQLWKQACEDALRRYVPLYRGTKHSFATGKLLEGYTPQQIADFLGVSRGAVSESALWARELSTPVLGDELAEEARGERVGKRPRTLH